MSTRYETKTIEHLGLVATMFDELGVGELIDQLIPQDFEQRQVTIGQAVKAMVLNGLRQHSVHCDRQQRTRTW